MLTRTVMRSCQRPALVSATILMWSSLGALALGVGPRRASAQPASPPTAVLLKRIAEAVDGHRTGALVFVVAALEFPHDVAATLEDSTEANRLVAARPGTRRFGPYQTEKDPGLQLSFISKCVHLESAMHETYCPERPILPFTDVDSVQLAIFVRNAGAPRMVSVPKGADAMFFTLSAIDKFVIPYYTSVLGLVETARMRQRLVNVLLNP